MYKKDFILRMIHEIIQLVGKILGLIKNGDYSKAQELIDRVTNEYLKIPWDTILQKDNTALLEYLQKEKGFENDTLEITAQLMKAQGELYFKKGENKNAEKLLKKSYFIYKYVDKMQSTFSVERNFRISELELLLKNIKYATKNDRN